MVTRSDAAHVVKSVFEEVVPAQWSQVLDMDSYISSDGFLASCADEEITMAFGVRHGLTATADLLTAAAEVCVGIPAGHTWISPGADDHNWSVLWGMKLRYSWFENQSLAFVVMECLANHSNLLRLVDSKIASQGGAPYWPGTVVPGTDLVGNAMVLMMKI